MRVVVSSGQARDAGDGNKRYRPLIMHFDARANILNTEIGESWTEELKEQWRQNKENVRREIATEYGEHGFDDSLETL